MKNTGKFEWDIWMESSRKAKKAFDTCLKRKSIKIEEEKKYLSLSHMKKAEYNLEFVNFLLKHEKFNDWIIIGCYYVIYHGALALLAKKGYSSKKHLSTLCGLIYLYYGKENGLNRQDIELVLKSSLNKTQIHYFVHTKQMRETASYSISEDFNISTSKELRLKTIEFLNKCREILE